MRFMIVLVIALIALLVGLPSGFLPSPETVGHSCASMDGFWSGLLHGFLLLWTFLAGFLYDVGVYEPCNTGAWYNGGFLLGVIIYFGASASRRGSSD